MQRQQTKRRKPNVVLSLIATCFLFNLCVANASQEVVYKESREYKGVIADKTSTMPEKKDAADAAAKYDPTGKTDPFKSFIAKQEEYEKKKKERPRTYLETLELSQLALIAVIVSKKGNWAMVQDSKGMGHVVRKGTPIGTNDGIIKLVREREIVVQEKIRDLRGNINVIDTIKKMPSRK